MAYGYLLAPSFQSVNINGKPLVGGHIEVYLANTETKYITKCDFDGTDNPFKIPLDSKGMAVVIASGDFVYDVFCYDQFESLFWSRRNVRIEGAVGVVIDGANLPLRIVGGKIDNNGKNLTCTGENAWAEGQGTTASGANAHAEGGQTTASGEHSHSEGFRTTASSGYSHAEGAGSKATNTASHAEGQDTTASGQASHAEGRDSVASGNYSHASGRGTRATSEGSHAVGKFNDDGDALFVVGNGTNANNRKDVFKVDRNEDTWVMINGVFTKVTNVSGNGGDQFVLVRSNMTTDFTNDEYKDCVDAVTDGKAVCVQYVQTGTTFQVQLVGITSGGTLVFEYTAEQYHYQYEVASTNNAHTITQTFKEFGTKIYASLQDAISNSDALEVGMYFETNGFHTSGDGGSARYLVSTSGTANGMDIVSLGGSKNAIAQLKGCAYTEQIGYVVNSSQADVVPYIKRLLAIGIQTIKFFPTGSAPVACYCIRDMLDLDLSDYHNVGVQLEGADIGQTSGYATWFNFQPSVLNTEKVAIKIHARTTRIKNIALIYGAGTSNISIRDSSAAICFDSTGNSSYKTSSYGSILENMTIQGFDTAIRSMGTSPYIWHVDCEKITFASNNTHLNLNGLSYCTTFRNCLFNSPDVQSVYLGEPFTVKFDSCNFGIDYRGVTIIRSVKWVIDGAPVNERRGLSLFVNCNMEVEYRNTSVPQNNKHLFVYADNDSQIDYEFDNCIFIYTPLTRENITSDRMFSLGDGSSVILRNCCGPYDDVNYSGNEYYEKDYDKYFFDESRPPEKKVGSLKLEHCIGIDALSFLDSGHLPCLKKDDDVILCDNNTDLSSFKAIGDGTIMFNLDRFVPIVTIANNLVDCASAPSGVVRIGNELYDYVVIDGRRWISRNLNLRIETRQHTIWDHLEWGQYYKYSDLSSIQSALPSGWRIPNAGDVTSLVGDGTSARAHNLQSTGVSYWTSATNSTGFSALPSTWWNKPNTTPHPTFKQYAFYWTTATEGSNVNNISIAPNAVFSGGWTSSEASSLWIPIRVCADE